MFTAVTYRIATTHTFDVLVSAVETGMTDRDFYAQLELPDIEAPRSLDARRTART